MGIVAYLTDPATIANFQDTTGFDLGGVWQWVGTDILKPMIGMTYLFLNEFKYWLIVLLVLGAIVTFSQRAFKFYKV